MILVFNKAGVLFLVFGGLGAWVVWFVQWALGFDVNPVPWALISFCAVAGGFDIACRYYNIFRSAGPSWSRAVNPSTGGHLFYIPVWIVTLAIWWWRG
jgi:hypothetical protein